MGLLLKQLDIHGFKSFATPTTFVFDRGVTAIVGPNGSGKSNVAEALRWVLGEQGHANLRSRRTEDVIFAGSEQRSQMSLAEVTLVLDNSDGSLPLAYNEVTVSRRAFRTGENQYLINGSRVRLKDVQQLVAPLGQAYTIIGQGLVDAALSQKPEERRGLFEHAAGIGGLRLRANDAERSLGEAAGNAQRLRDILGELEPRVRSLERSARLAREYGAVRDQLRAAQRLQYAHQWIELCSRHEDTQHYLDEANAACERQALIHAEVTARLGGLRGRERAIAQEIQSVEAQVREREQELVRARHVLDLLETRSRANAERRADLSTSLRATEQEKEATVVSIDRYRVELSQLTQLVSDIEMELAARDAAIAAAMEQRAEMQARLSNAERSVVDLSRQTAGLEGQLQSHRDRRDALQEELRQAQDAEQYASRRRVELQRDIENLSRRVDELRIEVERLTSLAMSLDRRLEADTLSARQLNTSARDVERKLSAQRARLESLDQLHRTGEGLYAGVRSLVRAVNRNELELPGYVGVLAETLTVPRHIETAIEVALGGHLQDVIVRRWSDAHAAIEFLKQAGAGRATFQPLDTVRTIQPRGLDIGDPQLLGIASDLIEYPAELEHVINQLLGRTLVVADLDVSRRILERGGGWTIVTLSGEITRPSGSVTGGARVAEAGLLARERERRALPQSIARDDARLAQLRGQELELSSLIQIVRDERDAVDRATVDTRRLLAETVAQREQASRELESHDTAATRVQKQIAEFALRLDEVERSEDAIHTSIQSLAAELDERTAETATLRQALQTFTIESDLRASELRSEMAAARERMRSLESTSIQLEQRLAQLTEAIEARSNDIQRLDTLESEAEVERKSAVVAIERLAQSIAGLRDSLPPRHSDRAALAAEIDAAERELDRSIETLREYERARDRASLNVARAMDERVFLIERIHNDLELADPTALEREAPDAADVPSDADIARLRERLRRMAVVGPDVVDQFEAESERFRFLSQQLADVDDAAVGLRKVLDELSSQMSERFTATFRDVSDVFQQTFTRLFGGGSARLDYNDSGDGTAGIDIVAQPPGKRLQSLNALSGGERALTAVALLIAIQRVNPSPFCLLDEVDAALDESNVLRFRDEIRDLSESTQFVLITHNRGTIEGADTLYGVTMGDDGVSRVLSLRLDDAIAAVESIHAAG